MKQWDISQGDYQSNAEKEREDFFNDLKKKEYMKFLLPLVTPLGAGLIYLVVKLVGDFL